MTIGRIVQTLFSVSLLLVLAAATVAGVRYFNDKALVENQHVRLESYRLADELRQTSDDLTRFARSYAVTLDPKFERYYSDVLAIRKGEKPRPEDYDRIYWDLV